MQFKSRFDGELVLSKGDIRTRRPIRNGEHVSFSAKTVERFGDDIRALAKKGLLAALDDEARGFLDPKFRPERPAPEPVPEPTPEPVTEETKTDDAPSWSRKKK